MKPYRFINRSGGLNVVRKGVIHSPWSDAYHALIVLKWRWFFLIFLALYVIINLAFALLYVAGGDCITGAEPGSVVDMFFFSVQTLSTIGYGGMSPKTPYADVLVALEAFVGMLFTAMSTGLLFSKFSRPTARVIFSNRAVIHEFNGVPTLMFRAANMRGNEIVEATMSVSLARFEVSREGERFRRFYDVPMQRQKNAMFVLSWTAMHSLDERSPLVDYPNELWLEQQAELIVSITGTDGTFGQTVHARHSYTRADIVERARFVDMIHVQEDGRLVIDYDRFDDVEPLERGPSY